MHQTFRQIKQLVILMEFDESVDAFSPALTILFGSLNTYLQCAPSFRTFYKRHGNKIVTIKSSPLHGTNKRIPKVGQITRETMHGMNSETCSTVCLVYC